MSSLQSSHASESSLDASDGPHFPREDYSRALNPYGLTSRSADGLFRAAVLHRLAKLRSGRLRLTDSAQSFEFGELSCQSETAVLQVRNARFYRAVVLGGGIGAAESYIRGDWDSLNLTAAMRVLARDADLLTGIENGAARLLMPLKVAANWLRRNTRVGSQRNIAAHYDLSNDFFALMLDRTMTYSSGIFASPDVTLDEASVEKYDRICRKLQLQPNDQLLEIGTGWGGFAEHAARNYGCRVTTTTISQQQHAYARQRFESAGLADRITLLQQDYRDLQGKYDKLVSIEMIEAVGEAFLPTFFAKCSSLLKPDGMFCLQAITMPDHRYNRYRKSVDFIQQYIFPGGFLPSISAIANCVGSVTDFRFLQIEDFAPHYAQTLAHWHENFWRAIDDVKQLGFDERFIRTWNYYLCYCEAGFHERQVGVAQILLTKPACRRKSLLAAV